MTKQRYQMSPAEFEIFKRECNAATVLVIQRGEVKALGAEQKAHAFWHALGIIHGFDWHTAEPIEGDISSFLAEPVEDV